MTRTKKITVLIGTALLAISLVGCNKKASDKHQVYQEAFTTFEKKLKNQMEKDGIPGASLSVIENGDVIYSKGFGYANKEQKTSVKKNTLFSTGSIGKVYATVALLKLAQDNKLSLDDPVVTHLPNFVMKDPRYKDITIRMLLNHTSGLPNNPYAATSDWAGSIPKDDFSQLHLEELKTQMLKSNPGEYAVYNNTGFEIAQNVIEKVSKQTYKEYLNENFFKPLGLKNTFLASNTDLPDESFALPVDLEGKNLPREYTSSNVAAAGGLIASTQDTCKFMNEILSPASGILNSESIKMLRSDQSLKSKLPEQQYLNALGWDEVSRSFPQTPVYIKSGGTANFSSQVITAPDVGISIAASISQFNYYIYDELQSLLWDIFLEKGVVKENNAMPSVPQEVTANASDSLYSGIYFGEEELSGLAGLQKIAIEDNVMKHFIWNGVEWEAIGEYTLREDTYYGAYDEKNKQYISYSFKTIGENVYLMKKISTPQYQKTTAVAKKIVYRPIDESWKKYDNTVWLRTNVWPTDYQAGACLTTMQFIEELGGYVAMSGGFPILETVDETYATGVKEIVGHHYGDLKFSNIGFSWMGQQFINSTEAIELSKETTVVSFEKANTMQWYYVPEDMEVHVDVPYEKVRIMAFDPELTQSYDNISQSGVITLTAGSYIGFTAVKPTQINIGVSSTTIQ